MERKMGERKMESTGEHVPKLFFIFLSPIFLSINFFQNSYRVHSGCGLTYGGWEMRSSRPGRMRSCVMSSTFTAELGRLFHEKIYQREIAYRVPDCAVRGGGGRAVRGFLQDQHCSARRPLQDGSQRKMKERKMSARTDCPTGPPLSSYFPFHHFPFQIMRVTEIARRMHYLPFIQQEFNLKGRYFGPRDSSSVAFC